MSAARLPDGRHREQGEAEARSARLRAGTKADAQSLHVPSGDKEAGANCAPTGGSAAAPAAGVGVHQ